MSNILVVTTRDLDVVDGGDKVRINGIISVLEADPTCTVDVVMLSNESLIYESDVGHRRFKIKHSYRQIIINLFRSVFKFECFQKYYYYNNDLISLLRGVISDYDVVILHLGRLAYLKNFIKRDIKIILEMTDCLSNMYEDCSKMAKGLSLKRIAYMYERLAYYKFEEELVQDFENIVVVSEHDQKSLIEKYNQKSNNNILKISNGIDIPLNYSKSHDGNGIMFIGNLLTLQNQHAISELLTDNFINFLVENDLCFHVIGKVPRAFSRKFCSPYIKFSGFLNDITPVVQNCFCGINPVQIGAGIQNKALMMGAYGLPVVSYSASASRFSGALPLFVVSNLNELISQVSALHNDRNTAKIVGECMRKQIENTMSWQRQLESYKLLVRK